MRPGRIILSGLAAILILGALAGCGPGSYMRYSVWDYEGRTDRMQDGATHTDSWSATAPGSTPTSSMTMGSYYNSDQDLYHNFRLLFSFSLMGFEGATVSSAHLHVYLESQVGTPFSTLNPAHVEQVNYDSSTTAQHKHEDADASWFDALISDGAEEQWKIVDVTEAVQYAIDQDRTMVQFRLKHAGEVFAGSGNNLSTWAASGIDQAHHPYLEVTLAP